MRSGHRLTDDLVTKLKNAIRTALSSRHIPRYIFEVDEIPTTYNDKKVETLVKQVICTGKLPKHTSSMVANPKCLHQYAKFYLTESKMSKL